jgi:hypothetical protein
MAPGGRLFEMSETGAQVSNLMRKLKFKSDGTVQWQSDMHAQDMCAYRAHKDAVLQLAKLKATPPVYFSEEEKECRAQWQTSLIELKFAAEYSLRTDTPMMKLCQRIQRASAR